MNGSLVRIVSRAENWLARFKRSTLSHWIDGEPSDSSSGEAFDNHTPVDNGFLGAVASGDADDVDRAAQAAARAFGGWRTMADAKRRAQGTDWPCRPRNT